MLTDTRTVLLPPSLSCLQPTCLGGMCVNVCAEGTNSQQSWSIVTFHGTMVPWYHVGKGTDFWDFVPGLCNCRIPFYIFPPNSGTSKEEKIGIAFSKVLSTMSLHSKSIRALTFENSIYTRQHHENLGRPGHRALYRCRQIRGDHSLWSHFLSPPSFFLFDHIF